MASVPYDVVNTSEARELAQGLPHSFLHIVRAEIDLPPQTGSYDDAVYAKARTNFERFLHDGVLIRDSRPRMYLYRQVMNHKSQVGLVCCCHIDDYLNDVIKKHEKTRKDKEDDRTRHILELNVHAEPVFLAYRDEPRIDGMVRVDMNDRPLFHFIAKDGVTHTVWPVHDSQAYVDAFASDPGVPVAYIADGHHRSASAARAAAERRKANRRHTGAEEYNWFLTVLFPASQLRILPYNRLVRDLHGKNAGQVLKELKTVGRLSQTSSTQPPGPGAVCIYLDRSWHSLQFDPASIDHSEPINSLDVSLLQNRILAPILGIGDLRTDKRIDFVGGIRGPAELVRRVDSGEMAIGFSMHPTTMDQLIAVADAGSIMPPKSTWFEPKLRSGLLIHSLD
ncbi:MAG: DUF1015 family protein [Phycisphaerales bacterium]|nr:DUF1015 family protein [Phycisphaerales bacterium]MCI0630709.1 DUF1015 family protein [Phycisphaerales bacterium]MCI0677327.1 DUF1015 family protein [Phycisphaerales bacterium]